jgi:hypothetical protein
MADLEKLVEELSSLTVIEAAELSGVLVSWLRHSASSSRSSRFAILQSEKAQLEFVEYELEEPKYDVEECQQRET